MFGEVPCRSPKGTHSVLPGLQLPVSSCKNSSNSSSFCFIPASSHWTAKCPAAEPSFRIDAASPQNVWRRCGLAAVRARATTNSSCSSLACKEPSPISHEAPEPGAAEIRTNAWRASCVVSWPSHESVVLYRALPIQYQNSSQRRLTGGVGF